MQEAAHTFLSPDVHRQSFAIRYDYPVYFTRNVFDPAMAERLRKYIYAAGGSADPEELYTAFRGKMPSPDAMMEKRGLL